MKRYSTHPAVYAGLVGVALVSVPRTAMAVSAQTLSVLPGPRVVIPAAVAACVGIAGITYAVVRKQSRRQQDNSWQSGDVAWHLIDETFSASDATESDTTPAPAKKSHELMTSNVVADVHGADTSIDTSTDVGAHEARDYEQIAQNYVNKQRYAQRVAIQKQGVKATLLERLGARLNGNMMDGLPVIERADGSVGDVGTSWWEATVGPNITRGSLIETMLDDPTAPQPQTPTPAEAHSRRRHAEVVSRVAHLDLGMYPERRKSEELNDKRDMWELALAALDEKLDDTGSVAVNIPSSAPKPVVASAAVELTGQMVCVAPISTDDALSNVVTANEHAVSNNKSTVNGVAPYRTPVLLDMDTLDEPDFPAESTGILHFRVPANHPEVTDEKSYVEYLISDEEAKARSKRYGAHAKKYDYLRVIDGGTSTRLQVLQPAKKSGYKPRHMKQVSEVGQSLQNAQVVHDSFALAQQG
ncbi:hypothetical protein [Atopobium fossor]|uniref:hypothetical protein n=1 Tax=Atopobium fossor TaxID=39487 RepID=UPI0003FF4E57|nr:hypothetical protein [Atopobium fossor]